MLKPLVDHISPETAYVITDYPYGFELRCYKRVWLERHPNKGYRLCYQTSNPKAEIKGNLPAGTVWNAVKKSTYLMLAIMGLDDQGHVQWTGCSVYDFSKLEEFGKDYAEHLNPDQRRDYETMLKIYKAYEAKKAAAAK